jgi:3-carboxy-cis,cis-muconate cycloisomerase
LSSSGPSSGGLFSGLFVPDRFREATSDAAWLAAMLEVEAALAAAEAEAGVVPPEAAKAIAAACEPGGFDPAALGREARASGNPVVPLVAALREKLPAEAAGFVHLGATSQDVLDSAAMLVALRTRQLIDAEMGGIAVACAGLAEEHRATLMSGRTLLQQALPITFGLKAAGWLSAILDARERLASVPLAVQLGGAAGTQAALGADGVKVLGLLAAKLGLVEPAIPWHTARMRVADLGVALALAAGAVEKIALDLALLAQTELGEIAESVDGARGGSSTLPQKRNPVGSVLAIASARRVRGAAGVLLAAMAQEHERAAGAWHSEWETLSEALEQTGGAAASVRGALEGLVVNAERMRENLDTGGGLVMAESVVTALGAEIDRVEAKRLVEAAAGRAIDAGTPLREQLVNDPAVSAALSAEQLDRALDPAGYLGSADAFVDRSLARYRESGGAR